MTGNSTPFANLPTPMDIVIETKEPNILVFAQMSRVQSSHPNINTVFRILLDGNPIAIFNTGGSYGWGYDAINFHGAAENVPPGHHRIEVDYATQGGTVTWVGDTNGQQQRILTVLSFEEE